MVWYSTSRPGQSSQLPAIGLRLFRVRRLGSALSFRSQKFFNLLSGRPKTVILNGEIDQNALRTLRLTVADLMEALRGKDVFDPRDVSYAVIETNGTLSVALRPEKEPARLSDLQLRSAGKGELCISRLL